MKGGNKHLNPRYLTENVAEKKREGLYRSKRIEYRLSCDECRNMIYFIEVDESVCHAFETNLTIKFSTSPFFSGYVESQRK